MRIAFSNVRNRNVHIQTGVAQDHINSTREMIILVNGKTPGAQIKLRSYEKLLTFHC